MSHDPTKATTPPAAAERPGRPSLAGRDAEVCAALVRAEDPDRYYATLFAPADKRAALFALYAFNIEVARVREAVSEAMPGEIRLQWWRDALMRVEGRGAEGNPVAAELDRAIRRYRLPRDPLLALIDARVFDLYDDQMPSQNDLEGYAAETSSGLIRLASLVLADGADPGGAEAAGHAGVAYAVTGLLRAFPWHAARGQIYIPREFLERNGVTRDDIVLGRGGPGVLRALAEMRGVARAHLGRTRALKATIAPKIAPAFLPVALVQGYLDRMDRADYDPYRVIVQRAPWRRLWTLWRQARRAGIG